MIAGLEESEEGFRCRIHSYDQSLRAEVAVVVENQFAVLGKVPGSQSVEVASLEAESRSVAAGIDSFHSVASVMVRLGIR